MELKITTTLVANINFNEYGIDKDLPEAEKIVALEKFLNDSGEDIIVLLESLPSTVKVEKHGQS